MSDLTNRNLDAIDTRIVAELQMDARISNLELAERVGLSPSPCARRVRLLEETGVIGGYHAALNRKLVGYGLTVFAGIKVERHSQHDAESFVAAVLTIVEVVGCHLVSGEMDYILEIVALDVESYEMKVLRRLLAIPQVRDIRSNFSMRSHLSGRPLPLNAPQTS